MTELEYKVHTCRDCYPKYRCVVRYYPVYSFHGLDGKPIWVVAINPSTAEYKRGFLSNSLDIVERRHSQQSYFSREHYTRFFGKVEGFFEGEVRGQVVQWSSTPWEKVGFTDLVKCATKLRGKKGQFSSLEPGQRQEITGECDRHLKCQLSAYRPKLVVAYGAPVCDWFSRHFMENRAWSEYDARLSKDHAFAVSFVTQRWLKSGESLDRRVSDIQSSIIAAFKLLGCQPF